MPITLLLSLLLIIPCVKYVKSPPPNGGLICKFSQELTIPIRGILALLIVAHHLLILTIKRYDYDTIYEIGANIVAIFFFLSGYGLGYSFLKKKTSYLNSFLQNRLKKILPTFILLTLIALLLRIDQGKSLFNQVIDYINQGAPPLPYSWFMYSIIYSYLAFWISAKIGKTVNKTGWIFLFTTICYIYIVKEMMNYPSWWWRTIIFVNCGYFVAINEDVIERLLYKYNYLIYIFILTSLLLGFFLSFKIFAYNTACYLFWQLTIVMALYFICRGLGTIKNDFLKNVGLFSMELYLVHGLPIMLCENLGFPGITMWILVPSLSIPLAYSLHKGSGLLIQYLDKYRSRLRLKEI